MNERWKFSILQLILPRQVVADLRTEANERGISVITLVRNVLEQHLSVRTVSRKLGGRTVHLRLNRVNLDEPVVHMTPDEEKFADWVMEVHREEDR